jgi:hypothetical protein
MAPDNAGSPITGYTVLIRESDDFSFSTDLTNCDASSSLAVQCTIPVTSLIVSPFSLAWGSSVHAKVIAKNIYGNSDESVEGNGAVITTTPDAPINLAEDYSQRTKSTLAIQWDSATFTGGATIDYYRISYAVSSGTYTVLADNHLTTSITLTGLTAGLTYKFKVESKNSYSYSPLSDELYLLCAFIPDAPSAVTSANSADQVLI